MSVEFDTPSSLFRWCLANTETKDPTYSYRACFPRYRAAAAEDGYLWRAYDRRLEEVQRSIGPGTRVLEVGSGFGHDIHWAAVRGAKALGSDVNSAFVEIARDLTGQVEAWTGRPLDIEIRRQNVLDLPEAEQFDLIYMKDVFHHLEPREQIVAKLTSLLAQGGTLAIVEPNALNPLIQYQMFRIRGLRTVISKVDAVTGEHYLFGNERLVSGRAMRRAFAAHGVGGHFRYFRLLPTALASRPALVQFAKAAEHAGLERLLPPLCIHCVFVGVKAA